MMSINDANKTFDACLDFNLEQVTTSLRFPNSLSIVDKTIFFNLIEVGYVPLS